MPKVNATIDTVGEANTENQRTATFSPGNGNPAWTEVKNNGDIDLSKQGAQPNVDIVFTLPTGFTFSATAPFSPVSGDFEVVSGAGTAGTDGERH